MPIDPSEARKVSHPKNISFNVCMHHVTYVLTARSDNFEPDLKMTQNRPVFELGSGQEYRVVGHFSVDPSQNTGRVRVDSSHPNPTRLTRKNYMQY